MSTFRYTAIYLIYFGIIMTAAYQEHWFVLAAFGILGVLHALYCIADAIYSIKQKEDKT